MHVPHREHVHHDATADPTHLVASNSPFDYYYLLGGETRKDGETENKDTQQTKHTAAASVVSGDTTSLEDSFSHC